MLIVGAGKAGLTIAFAAARTEHIELVCRDKVRHSEVLALVARVGADISVIDKVSSATAPSVVIVATADRDIAGAARQLHEFGLSGEGVTWLHLSGVEVPQLLSVTGARASVASCHPLCAIPDPVALTVDDTLVERAVRPLQGAFFAIASDSEASRVVAHNVALLCGGRPASLPTDGRALYHAAACLVANDLVGLLAIGEALCADAGMTPGQARRGLLHLATTALEALRQASSDPDVSLADGLTGPVGRGDAVTLGAHLTALKSAPLARTTHVALSDVLLALVSDRLPAEQVAAVRAVLQLENSE